MTLDLQIYSLSGERCCLQTDPDITVPELKTAIKAQMSIPERERQLFSGVEELGRTVFALTDLVGDEPLVLQLVRRDPQQARWLQEVRTQVRCRAPKWFKQAPVAARGDRDVMLAAVAQNWQCLSYATRELKADRQVILAGVSQNGYALKHASNELQ